MCHLRFQSTCLREARLRCRSSAARPRNFNPRAYVRHDVLESACDVPVANFNPRAYVRHDRCSRAAGAGCRFQSTCLREARQADMIYTDPPWSFQSTCLREARRSTRAGLSHQATFQSTCLREARHRHGGRRPGRGRFQSTCLREARPPARRQSALTDLFQSTCLREARLSRSTDRGVRGDFNPRAYVRHDRMAPAVHRRGRISIHVPT